MAAMTAIPVAVSHLVVGPGVSKTACQAAARRGLRRPLESLRALALHEIYQLPCQVAAKHRPAAVVAMETTSPPRAWAAAGFAVPPRRSAVRGLGGARRCPQSVQQPLQPPQHRQAPQLQRWWYCLRRENLRPQNPYGRNLQDRPPKVPANLGRRARRLSWTQPAHQPRP